MSKQSSGRPKPTAGDYAVIAIAPILTFIMISSLANFLMLVIYRGGQPARVSWTVLMFTMGVVGIARIAIEKDRTYSLGYAGVLGLASFVTLIQYVSSPVATLLLLGLIAYLADWVIRDCTLIDEDADSSDRGLLDSLKRGSSQPGRSVLYLALAAFPLYGLGQFFIRGDSGTWSRAHWLLACYLFSALALLVTTSFLGLRRYLRQRGADMPGDVSKGWLGGGAAIIAILLGVAFLVPVPGKALASLDLPSFDLPSFLDSSNDTTASKQGWGEDGADKAGSDAASTGDDANLAGKEKEVGKAAAKKGAPAGDVGDGERKDGPTGKQEGGKKKSPGDKKSAGKKGQKREGEQKPSQNGEAKQTNGEKQDEPANSEPTDSQSEQAKSEHAKKTETKSQSSNQPNANSPTDDASNPFQKAANLMPAVANLLKWLILAVLIGFVGVYVYVNREFLIEFWQNLFSREESPIEPTLDELIQEVQSAPRRSFSAMTRPNVDEADPKKVVVATFAGLDAWCHETGVSRTKEETPTEFLARVRQNHKQLSKPASRVITAYNRIVYGRGNAGSEDVRACDQLWDLMKH